MWRHRSVGPSFRSFLTSTGPHPYNSTMASSALPAKLGAEVEAWLAADPDPVTRAEIAAFLAAADVETLAQRFDGRLTFGTAGLRAALGAGPTRMNELVVAQTTAGLVEVLLARSWLPPTVVIAHDARHGSAAFGRAAAAIVGREGHAVVLPPHVPTPVLAYAVRYEHAQAGVMITASHNPPKDNGYKVYLDHGAQITPPIDTEIAEAIADAAASWEPAGPAGSAEEVHSAADIVDSAPALVDDYLQAITGLLRLPDRRSVAVVYTALHGVAAATFRAAFALAGFPPVVEVAEQAEPDPDFPTVAFPNPEEPGALDLALDLAARTDADVVLANDPDGDRLGVAVPTSSGDWRVLRGDEIGVLLADHLLRADTGDDRLVVTTVVSSRVLAALAAHHGVHYEETLTGFKWIAEAARRRSDLRFVLGYEEALGYAIGDVVADKDGISAGLVFAELVADLLDRGSSVESRLEELAERHGLHLTRQVSVRFDDRATGALRQRELMDGLRSAPPTGFGEVAVARITDLNRGEGELPPTNALRFDLVDGTRIMVRPSGTEPKVKYYLEVIETVGDDGYEHARSRATLRLDRLAAELTD